MSKPSAKPKNQKAVRAKPSDYNEVLASVVELLDAARRVSARVVNSLMTATYWEIGRRIVEHEQAGSKRAGYGGHYSKACPATSREDSGADSGSSNFAPCGNSTRRMRLRTKSNR